jgi:hypothetical protein
MKCYELKIIEANSSCITSNKYQKPIITSSYLARNKSKIFRYDYFGLGYGVFPDVHKWP